MNNIDDKSIFNLNGREINIASRALETYVKELSQRTISDIPLENIIYVHEEYKAAKKLSASLSEVANDDRPYHSLLLMDDSNESWDIEFGDYDYDVVIAEASQYESDAASPYMIITTGSDQESIKAEVLRLNVVLFNENLRNKES